MRRSLLIVLATGGVWLLVVLVEERRFAGSVTVTTAGFVAATSLMAALITFRRSGPRVS